MGLLCFKASRGPFVQTKRFEDLAQPVEDTLKQLAKMMASFGF